MATSTQTTTPTRSLTAHTTGKLYAAARQFLLRQVEHVLTLGMKLAMMWVVGLLIVALSPRLHVYEGVFIRGGAILTVIIWIICYGRDPWGNKYNS